MLALCIAVTLLACAVVLVIYWSNNGAFFKGIPSTVLAIGLIMLPFLIWEEYGSSLLILANRLRTYNAAQFIGRTAGLAALVILIVWMDTKVIGAMLAQVSGQAILASMGFFALF